MMDSGLRLEMISNRRNLSHGRRRREAANNDNQKSNFLLKSQSMTRVIIIELVLIACAIASAEAAQELSQQQQLQPQSTTTERQVFSQNEINSPIKSSSSHQGSKDGHIIINSGPTAEIIGPSTTMATSSSSSSSSSSSGKPQASSTTTASSAAATSPITQYHKQQSAAVSSSLEPTPASSTSAPSSSSSSNPEAATASAPSQPTTPTNRLNSSSSPIKPAAGQQLQFKGSGKERQQVARSSGDLIDQMATSQSVSFAEPLMVASSQEQQQQPRHKGSSVGNRWTHFGARLRPLSGETFAPSGDHQRADSKSLPAYTANSNPAAANSNNRQPAHLNTNQVGDSDDPDDLDDEQDSEALLYKMMQQQGFLMGSNWQQQLAPDRAAAGRDQPQGSMGGQPQSLLLQLQVQEAAAQGGQGQAAVAGGDVGRNSKKVIKLLKSYSHIHQVDDSDDQIRGTYTRLPARRPLSTNNNDNGNWQQPRGSAAAASNGNSQHYNRNRSNGNNQRARQHPQAHHIFVSSQPMARAYSNPSARQHLNGDEPGYTPMSAYNNEQQVGAPADNSGNSDDSGAQNGPPPEEDDFECPNNGIFADEASGCQSYHVCQSGAQVQQKFQCPMGTLFNNIILTCDFAHNVQCKGKETAAAGLTPSHLRPAGLEESNDAIYRQPQQQQAPRASVQVEQGSYVSPQQQARWMPAQQQQPGPRHLKIGQSQYGQHQQNMMGGQAQAINAYPHPQPPSNEVDSDGDSDDEPVEPLVPATLPAPRQPASSQNNILPYSAPPPAAPQQYQTAHRSQQASQYSSQAPPVMANYPRYQTTSASYDTDTATYYSNGQLDEPRTTEASTGIQLVTSVTQANKENNRGQQQVAYTQAPQTTAGGQVSSEAQSFNLVINHVAPTRQQKSAHYAGMEFIKKPSNQIATTTMGTPPAKQSQLAAGNQQLASKRAEARQPHQQQQQVSQAFVPIITKPQLNTQSHLTAATLPVHSNRNSIAQQTTRLAQRPPMHTYNQPGAYDNQRQTQATQLKSIHVDGGQQQLAATVRSTLPPPSHPKLVDLTNDKRQSVSSGAINDGLVLIVRHASPEAQQHQLDRSQSQAHNYNKPQTTAAAKRSPVKQGPKQSNSLGQAYALDPSIVRPNSPIDAQLFPNVQRVIAASEPAVSHQVAQSSQYVQHSQPAQQQQPSQHLRQPTTQVARASALLKPMEPPKPSSVYPSEPQYKSERTSGASVEPLQLVAASSAPLDQLTIQSKKVSQQQQQPEKKHVKRSKRLKAHQAPTPKSTNQQQQQGELQKKSQQQQQLKPNAGESSQTTAPLTGSEQLGQQQSSSNTPTSARASSGVAARRQT